MNKNKTLVDKPVTHFGQIPVETVKKIFAQHSGLGEKEMQEKMMHPETSRSNTSCTSQLPIRVVRRKGF